MHLRLDDAGRLYGRSLAQTVVRSDDPVIVPDRPDFTDGSDVIPAAWLQFESGVRVEGESNARGFSAPAAMLRVGIGHRMELRFGTDGLLSESVEDLRFSGRADFELGTKVRLLDHDRAGFALALLPVVSLPTGSAGFTSGGVDPTLKIAWGRVLPAGFGLSGNVNFSSLSEDGTRYHQEGVSVSVGHDLFLGWGGYAEAYGVSKASASKGAGVTVNAGVSRLIGRRVQIDLEAGHGLTSAAPDWLVGFGFAIIAPAGPRR